MGDLPNCRQALTPQSAKDAIDMKNTSAVGLCALAATLLLGALAATAAAQGPAAKSAPAPAPAASKAKAKEAYPGEKKLGPRAKVTMETATATVLAARPGATIISKELETEAGGSGLRYSFDIKVGGKSYEVGVDAADGKILENATEAPAPAKGKAKAKAKG